MKNTAIIFILISVYATCQQSPQPYDIKGDQLGMSMFDFQKKYSTGSRDDPAPACALQREEPLLYLSAEEAAAGVISCYPGPSSDVSPLLGGTVKSFMAGKSKRFSSPDSLPPNITLANSPLKGLAFLFYKGRLFRIVAEFPADNYPEIKSAFADKFGAPAVTPHEMQNAYGAKFDGEECLWSNGVSTADVIHRAQNISTGRIVVSFTKIEEELKEALPKKNKDL